MKALKVFAYSSFGVGILIQLYYTTKPKPKFVSKEDRINSQIGFTGAILAAVGATMIITNKM